MTRSRVTFSLPQDVHHRIPSTLRQADPREVEKSMKSSRRSRVRGPLARTSLLLLTAALVLASGAASQVSAQTGTLLAGPFAPIGDGNGRGMAFDGVNLYITRVGDSSIYKITPPLPTGPVVTIPVPGGDPRVSAGGPLAWDGSALWTVDYSG